MQIAFCKLLSAAQPMYFCSWQTAIYLYGTHTLASLNEKSLHINILMLELHNKVPGCFSLSPSLILLMTPSIPHTAHTVRRPRGDAGNMSQYPATGDWSKVRGAQEGGSVSAWSAHSSPGQGERAKGPGLRNTRTGWCLIPRQDRTISPSSINNLSKSKLHESRHIRNYSGQSPFSHSTLNWIYISMQMLIIRIY